MAFTMIHENYNVSNLDVSIADPDPPSCSVFQYQCSYNSEHSIM